MIRLKPSAFSPEISVGNLYPSDGFKEAQHRLSYLLDQRGLGALVGDIGSGKTTAVRAFTAKLAAGSHLVLYGHVAGARSPLRPFVEDFLVQLGERVPFNNTAKGLRIVQENLRSSYDRNRVPFVILDDAHLLDPKALLQLKALTNYQMDSAPPLSLLLVGAPLLARTLAVRELEEVRQRLLFCFPLRNLRREEVEPYIQARLKAAGHDVPLFPRDVIEELHLHSQGNPRLLNQLASFCLMAGAAERKELVDRSCLLQAVAELTAFGGIGHDSTQCNKGGNP